MNTTELLYKRETGKSHKIGFECSRYKDYVLNVEISITDSFDDSEDIIELPTPDYIKWLEERSEILQKLNP